MTLERASGKTKIPKLSEGLSKKVRNLVGDGEKLAHLLFAIANGSEPQAKISDRLSAINMLFDRGWGKPVSSLEVSGEVNVTNIIQTLDTSDLKDLVRLREELIAHDESKIIDVTVRSLESLEQNGPDDPDTEVGPARSPSPASVSAPGRPPPGAQALGMAHQYVPRPGRHPPVWLMGTGQRPGGLQKADDRSWGRISRSQKRVLRARAGHEYGSCVRAGCPGTSMVHLYASQARAAGVWFMGTHMARAGGGRLVCSRDSQGPGRWCAHWYA